MNEEEIKVKYILPWLREMGIGLDELQLERTFTVHVGRRSIAVNSTSTLDSAGARFDILVRRGGRNLLIVETKAEHVVLTDGDRDQAISYARLVHPIAPYAVVTNGSDYRLYDVLSKDQVRPSEIKVGEYELELPEADIAEAQSLFLKLSSNNLFTFCRQQVAGELGLIKGTLGSTKKYIPELHVPRELIQRELHDFYSSMLPGLLLSGESGLGKTCELCYIAELLLRNGRPVLFFNGFSLHGCILDAISGEFSWTFTGMDMPAQLLRRVGSIVRDGFLTIIVDAIDEWSFESRVGSLASLLRAAQSHRVRVIMSCKSSAVASFLTCRDNPTHLFSLTRRTELQGFSPREFKEVIHRYRREYQFAGGFEEAVLQEARENPFILRVLFDVARSSRAHHLTFSSVEFFQAYYERALGRTSDKRRAAETLSEIAKLLYERDANWIAEREVRTLLRIGVNESLMEELFEYSLLLRRGASAEDSIIEFYFQQFRDFIIAYNVLRLNRMSAQQLASEFDSVCSPGTRSDVFALYYRLASKEHRSVFDAELRRNAASYLHVYTSTIQRHFPLLASAFRPKTEGRIGFIGQLVLASRCVGLYGFRAIASTDEEVHFVPVETVLAKTDLAYLDGAGYMHMTATASGFGDGINVGREVVEHEVINQIRELVVRGQLNESTNTEMLSELVIATISGHKDIFSRVINPDSREITYPLSLHAVIECLHREKLRLHIRYDAMEEIMASGKVQIQQTGGGVASYSISSNMIDEQRISSDLEEAMNSGYEPKSTVRFLDFEAIGIPLTTAIEGLLVSGNEIKTPLLGGSELLKCAMQRNAHVARDKLESYVTHLYLAFLRNYTALVEANFPTLKEHFHLYCRLPVSIHVVIGPSVQGESARSLTDLTVYFSKSNSGQCEVEVVDHVVVERTDRHLHFFARGVRYEGFLVKMTSVKHFVLEHELKLDNGCFVGQVLRPLVYSTIYEELPAVEDALRTLVNAAIAE